MKAKLLSILMLLTCLIFSNTSIAQQLSLSQLQSTLEMNNWEKVNQYLSNRDWEYYSSEKGDDEHYDEIVWTFSKNNYEDKAEGWFEVFAYDNKPQKITYQANKDIIIGIKNSLSGYGYSLKDSKIENDYLTSTYENSKYIIKVFTSSNNDDFSYGSVITHSLLLIKKEGVYDKDNGERIEYWEGTNQIKIKYRLKDGELNGEVTSYYANGEVKIKGSWYNGEKSGRFEEYEENGTKTYEYYISNGKLNGQYVTYYSNNAKVKKTGNYTNGKESGLFTEHNKNGSKTIEYNMLENQLNGTYISYYDNGQISMSGVYKDGKKHGYFIEYRKDGTKATEYNEENGLSNGFFITYHKNGKIKIKGNNVRGIETGLFSEYDDDGNLQVTYEMKNDKLNGIVKKYLNNEVILEKGYEDGILSGNYKEIFYIGENDEYKVLQTGNYKNDQEHGIWKLVLTNENKLLTLTNYQNGIKHGNFQEIKGDSLIFGSYNNDLLDGEYKIYKDLTKMFIGGFINTDSSDLILVTEGFYKQGKKVSKWKFYGLSDNLISTGYYESDEKHGRWDYYYNSYFGFKDSKSSDFSGKLYLTENYKYGLQDGVSVRYSTLKSIPVPCEEIDAEGDDCEEYRVTNLYEKLTYKKGILNGAMEVKNATGELQYKGQFLNDKESGSWFERIDKKTYEKGLYKSGKRVYEWDYFVNDKRIGTTLYENGEDKEINKYNAAGFIFEHYKYDGKENTYYAKYTGAKNNEILEKVKILNRYSVKASIEVSFYISDTLFIDTYTVPISDIITTSSCIEGKINGNSQMYVNDILLQKGEYKNDKKTGIWEFNYPVQNAQLKVNFYNSKKQVSTEMYYYLNSKEVLDKDFMVLDADSNIIEKRSIKDGMRNGRTIYYDTSGEKIKKERYKDGILQ